MKRLDIHERLHVMQHVERELKRLRKEYGTQCSDQCLVLMKRIIKDLRQVVLECEMAKIELRKQKGLITPMQARKEKAKVRKRLFK